MKGLTPQNHPHIKILRDYMRLNQQIETADVIIIPGSSGDSYIEKAVQLYQQGYADKIICSGHCNRYSTVTEAQNMSQILIEKGIPYQNIILEPQASNTAANMKYSYEICKRYNRKTVIIVHHPRVERRTYATAMKQLYKKRRPSKIMITSLDINLNDYDNNNNLQRNRTGQLIGNIQRIKFYGEKGRITHQEVPVKVQNAYLTLVNMGYKKFLMKGYPIW